MTSAPGTFAELSVCSARAIERDLLAFLTDNATLYRRDTDGIVNTHGDHAYRVPGTGGLAPLGQNQAGLRQAVHAS